MRRRLWFHAALLAVVLLGCLAFVGVEGVVSADEGAMLAQLDLLDRTGEWTLANPEPVVDADLVHLPLELSERSDEGRWAPFAKHPLHIALLRPAWAVGATGGVLVVSILGVVLAAACAGWLAERMRPGTGPVTLWLTGIGSPLLFDGYQVVAHALGAGLFGLAAVLAVSAGRVDHPVGRVATILGVGLATAATASVRAEGVLAGLALGAAFGLAGLLRRQWPVVAAGAAAGLAAVAVRFGEPRLVEAVLGGESIGSGASGLAERGGLVGRWLGFRTTVLEAGYGVDTGEDLLLLALLLAIAAALVWRLRHDERLVRMLAVGAAVLAVARLLTADFLVPGLLPALPLLAVALVLLDLRRARVAPRPELWATVGLFVLAVAATQYESGGAGEWGGRYFAIAVPVLVALATVVVAEGGQEMPERTQRVVLVCGSVVVLTIAAGALNAASQAKDAANHAADGVVARIDDLEVDATVSAVGAVGRFAWEDVLDGRRWLSTVPADVPAVVDALADDGVDRVALIVSGDDDAAELVAESGAGWEVREEHDAAGRTVALLERADEHPFPRITRVYR